jgi:hypothetical protein
MRGKCESLVVQILVCKYACTFLRLVCLTFATAVCFLSIVQFTNQSIHLKENLHPEAPEDDVISAEIHSLTLCSFLNKQPGQPRARQLSA